MAIERTAIASVRAFHFLHKVRFGGPIRPDLDPDDNSNTSDDDVSVVTTKRKYRVHPTPEDSDSEPQIEDSLLPDSQQLRRPRQLPDTQLVPGVSLSGTVSPPDAIPSTTNRTPTTAHLTPTTCGLALGNRTKPRVRARWKGQTTAKKFAGPQSMRKESCGDQRPKRKRWSSSNGACGRSSDHLDQRPAKQRRKQHESDGPAETLWTRLKQLEPLRTRRS